MAHQPSLTFAASRTAALYFSRTAVRVALRRGVRGPLGIGLARPALVGLAFGWSAYGVGVSWLHISLHTYGGLPSLFAWAAIAAFTLYLALFPALALGFYSWFSSKSGSSSASIFNALLWAGAWTFFEWARGTFMTGFAWLGLGDALIDSPFANLLPWLGSHGTLFVLIAGSAKFGPVSLLSLEPLQSLGARRRGRK